MSENAETPGCMRTLFPDPNVQESLQCENIPDPLAGEQTWPTEEVWGRILFQPVQTQGPGLQVSLLDQAWTASAVSGSRFHEQVACAERHEWIVVLGR